MNVSTPMTVEIVGSAFGNCDPVPFTTLNEASAKYRAFLDRHGLGARDAGSCYIRQHGRIVAHISYNGRVWAGTTWNGKDQPLFTP